MDDNWCQLFLHYLAHLLLCVWFGQLHDDEYTSKNHKGFETLISQQYPHMVDEEPEREEKTSSD